MNYSSTVTVISKVSPGTTYVLKKMSAGRRAAFNLSMADYFQKQRDLWSEREPLDAELLQILNEDRTAKRMARAAAGDPVPEDDPLADLPEGTGVDLLLAFRRRDRIIAARFSQAKAARIVALQNKEIMMDQDEMQPALVRWGLASITGLDIDGELGNAENLIALGDPDLFLEIATEISRVMRMSSSDAANLSEPSTSGAQAEGATSDTSAPSASAAATT